MSDGTATRELSDEELREVALEATEHMGVPWVAERLYALDLGLSLSERFFVYGTITERLRSRARIAELERALARETQRAIDYHNDLATRVAEGVRIAESER